MLNQDQKRHTHNQFVLGALQDVVIVAELGFELAGCSCEAFCDGHRDVSFLILLILFCAVLLEVSDLLQSNFLCYFLEV